MKERDIEDIIAKYSWLIEEGLTLKGRQVNLNGKFADLLFEDRFGQQLIVELKRGTILRKHIAQIMDYEGYLLHHDNPNIRVMLIGNRVPENLKRSLNHHGFEWKELTLSFLLQFLQEQNDIEILTKVDRVIENFSTQEKKRKKSMSNAIVNNERAIFWNQLLQKVKKEIPLNFSAPSKSNAVYASAGKTGMKWAFAIKKNEAWVELEIMLPGDKINSHDVFAKLYASKNEIEKKYGDLINWDKKESRKSCRIQTEPKEPNGIDNDNNWATLQDTLIYKMKKMFKVFEPYIQQI